MLPTEKPTEKGRRKTAIKPSDGEEEGMKKIHSRGRGNTKRDLCWRKIEKEKERKRCTFNCGSDSLIPERENGKCAFLGPAFALFVFGLCFAGSNDIELGIDMQFGIPFLKNSHNRQIWKTFKTSG